MTNNKKDRDEFDLEEINEDKESKNTKIFKKILWYFGAIIVVLFTLWGIVQYLVDNKIKAREIDAKLEKIVATQLIQKDQNDLILDKVDEVKVLVKENTETVEGLSNSYILFMENNKSLSKDDFRNYMEGVTWEVKKKAITKPDEIVVEKDSIGELKIGVRKKIK
jgi:hypothetical protein